MCRVTFDPSPLPLHITEPRTGTPAPTAEQGQYNGHAKSTTTSPATTTTTNCARTPTNLAGRVAAGTRVSNCSRSSGSQRTRQHARDKQHNGRSRPPPFQDCAGLGCLHTLLASRMHVRPRRSWTSPRPGPDPRAPARADHSRGARTTQHSPQPPKPTPLLETTLLGEISGLAKSARALHTSCRCSCPTPTPTPPVGAGPPGCSPPMREATRAARARSRCSTLGSRRGLPPA